MKAVVIDRMFNIGEKAIDGVVSERLGIEGLELRTLSCLDDDGVFCGLNGYAEIGNSELVEIIEVAAVQFDYETIQRIRKILRKASAARGDRR